MTRGGTAAGSGSIPTPHIGEFAGGAKFGTWAVVNLPPKMLEIVVAILDGAMYPTCRGMPKPR